MKYKKQILTKLNALEASLDYILRNLNSSTITAEDTVSTIMQQMKQLESVKELVEAEM
jgi:hypothetical protein